MDPPGTYCSPGRNHVRQRMEGNRTKNSLEVLIFSIISIAHSHLRDYRGASIAQKMSWASKRITTRIEVRAYSLMGLFHVQMPPLCGDGGECFPKLQLQILASSDGESLFAWTSSVEPGVVATEGPEGLLANSPSNFSDSGDIVIANID
jgi:hypothetical protein